MKMHLSSIRVDQLGGLTLSGLTPGLNVLYGPNGSGKSTLLRFVRTLLAAIRGDADLNDGTCDGTVELRTGEPLMLIGHRRRRGAATVGVRCVGSEIAPIDEFRKQVADLDLQFVDAVCLVDPLAAGHARDIKSIAESLARADEDAASPVRRQAVEQSLQRLDQECEHLDLELGSARRSLARAEREARAEQRRIAKEIADLEAEIQRLDLDHQAAVTDLREAEDCAWSGSHGDPVQQAVPCETADADTLRRMLELLARRRLDVSLRLVAEAESASGDLLRERQQIDDCERDLLELRRTICRASSPRPPVCSLEHFRGRAAGLESRLNSHAQPLRELHCEFRAAVGRHDTQLALRRRCIGELSAALSAARRQLADLRSKPMRVEPRLPGVLAAAGDYVRRLTLGRYDRLERRDNDAELCLVNGSESSAVTALSRGTLEQVAMAVRLAGANTALPGLPMVWDEVLADCDEARVAAACAVLAEAAEKRQIIMLTCRARIAELLARHGATLHTLGGIPLMDFADGAADRLPPVTRDRFWLEPDSPLSQIPSLGRQLLRYLTGRGLRNAGDLLIANVTAIAAEGFDSSAPLEQLTLAQAEARLLLSVPNLTARDAQLLVACGIATTDQLATCEVDDLIDRIDRHRSAHLGAEVPEAWPMRSDVETWIRMGRAGHNTVLRSGRKQQPAESIPAAQTRPGLANAYRLQRDAPVAEAPAIGLASARRLARFGVQTVADLMAADPEQLAQRLRPSRISADHIRLCQRQCRLMCAIPGLSADDARALVDCGMHSPRDLQRVSASALHGMLRERSQACAGKEIPVGEVARWIEVAHDLGVRAA